MLKKLCFLLCSCLGLISSPVLAAVILQYHHVSDSSPASTSVTPAQFREQMQYLADHDFNVVPLTQVTEAIRQSKTLAPRTVAITFDDGYLSIAEAAHPILKEFGFPYTLFVAIEPIEKGYREMMSWEQLRTLAAEGAEIANHSWGHEHLIRRNATETEEQWLARIEDNLLETEARIAKETGDNLKILAYPYGEYNSQLEALLQRLGFVGLGQQSGAAGPHSALTSLPRFPVAGAYADMNALKVKLHSLNMPVQAISPSNPELPMGQWRPELEVTLDMSDINQSQLMCYVQGQGAKKPQWLSANRFRIQAELDLPPGRSRYNCTAPSKRHGSYYWFSQAWVRPKDDGSWVKE
ncbi:polysaccharide deacetylase family protein [Shewanella algae]|uniref:polysaccharide deacetylase family protein n=1 Tax=Shewanella algae TaxID=38313 RepID=UPI003984F4A3